MGIKKSITNALGLGGGLAVGQKLIDRIVDKGVDKGVNVATERLKSDDEWRDEMYGHWLYTEGKSTSEKRRQGATGLIHQHKIRDALKDGSETYMMHTLGYFWEHMADMPQLRAYVFYEKLGHMNDEDFETALSAMHDDKIKQWFHKVIRVGQNAYKMSEEWAIGLFNRALDALVEGDHETTREKLKALHARIENSVPEPDKFAGAANAVDSATASVVRKGNTAAERWLRQRGA